MLINMRFHLLAISLALLAITSTASAQSCSVDADCATSGPGFECVSNQCDWIPPIGIPEPGFGIEETHYMYELQGSENCTNTPAKCYDFGTGTPEPYRDAGNGPYTHYVDNTDPNCKDNNNKYGSHTVPRCSLPTGLVPGTGYTQIIFGPGDVVEVHGGPYDYNNSGLEIYSMADSSNPAFLRGVGSPSPELINYEYRVFGQYLIIEGLKFYHSQVLVYNWWNSPIVPTNHISVRNNEIEGDGICRYPATPSGFRVYGKVGLPVNNIVLYNNHIHHHGQYDHFAVAGPPPTYTGGDSDWLDTHGVDFSYHSENIWAVDNHIHHNSGDSFQIGNRAFRTTNHVYVGRNEMHDDRENAMDIKEAEDVIVSQNKMHSYLDLGRNDDGGISVTHGGSWPSGTTSKNIWYIFNEFYDAEETAHASGGYVDGLYFVGNFFHDISNAVSEDASVLSGWNMREETIFIVGNTIVDSDEPIDYQIPGTGASIYVENNIISKSTQKGSHHVILEYNIDRCVMKNNLLYQNGGQVSIYYHDIDTSYNVSEFQQATGNCTGCIEQDPMFEDPANDDFSLLDGSPAIGAGTQTTVYDTFQSLYDLDIRVDFDGNPLTGWDMGAYESQGSTCITTATLLGHIQQWEQGSVSMPTLINYISAWKTGTGCP